MTKRKRFLSTLVLALVLFLNMIPQAKAAEGDAGKLSMTASNTAVSHGETVTVTVASNCAFETKGAGITVAYNAAELEPVMTDSKAKEGFKISGPMTLNGKSVLRISSFPGEGGHTVGVDEPLAVLAFRTLTPGDNIQVEMTAAYLYDTSLSRIEMALADPLSISAAVVPTTGIQLNWETVEMEINSTKQLTAAVLPENASNKTVTWTSSDETKLTVDENGLLTALDVTEENSPVMITAQSGDITVQCAVTVVYPPNVGYVVSVPKQKVNVVGEEIQIPLTVNNTNDVDKFNAFDITFVYDPDSVQVMDVTAPESTKLTVEDRNGKIQILGYGEAQTLTAEAGTTAFTLKVKALKTGSSYITIEDTARVDHSANAVISNAAKAALKTGESSTHIIIDKFTVRLPENFGGDTVADPSKPYQFCDTDANTKLYDYTFTGKMGSQDLQDSQVIRNEDGSFSIESVTGHLLIEATKKGKQYTVTLVDNIDNGRPDFIGADKAWYMEDYTFTVEELDVRYSIAITIGGASNHYPVPTPNGDSYTIPGKDIQGDIRIELTAETPSDPEPPGPQPPQPTEKVDVSFGGTGADDVVADVSGTMQGDEFTFEVNKEDGYRYSVTYETEDGETVKIWPDENGKYQIDSLPSDIQINISKEEKEEVTIEHLAPVVYLSLPDQTIYLVPVTIQLDDSERYTYDGAPMIYSEVYDSWCILTIESDALSGEMAFSKLDSEKGRTTVIEEHHPDVNMTNRVDINDAQLVYNMYKGKYDDFDTIKMESFLNADQDGNMKITVADVAGVVSAIE